MPLQMRFHLFFRFRQKTEVPFITQPSGDQAHGQRAGIPERIEQACAPAQLGDALLAPGKVIELLARRSVQRGANTGRIGTERLPLIKRLGADLTAMINAHQGRSLAPASLGQLRFGEPRSR